MAQAIDDCLRGSRIGNPTSLVEDHSATLHASYFAGKLEDRDYDEKELAMALAGLPAVAAA